MICTPHHTRNEIKKNEMDGAYNTYGGEEMDIQDFDWET